MSATAACHQRTVRSPLETLRGPTARSSRTNARKTAKVTTTGMAINPNTLRQMSRWIRSPRQRQRHGKTCVSDPQHKSHEE